MPVNAHVTYSAIDPRQCATVSPPGEGTVSRLHRLRRPCEVRRPVDEGARRQRRTAAPPILRPDGDCDVAMHGNGVTCGEAGSATMEPSCPPVAHACPSYPAAPRARPPPRPAPRPDRSELRPRAAEPTWAALGLEGHLREPQQPPESIRRRRGAALDGRALYDLDGFGGRCTLCWNGPTAEGRTYCGCRSPPWPDSNFVPRWRGSGPAAFALATTISSCLLVAYR